MYALFTSKPFLKTLLINFVWQNISEIFRYFVFIMPMMRAAFPQLPDIAPMSLSVFAIWSVWGGLLLVSQSFFTWVVLLQFGNTRCNMFASGTLIWLAVFGILWLALYNMNLATPSIMAVALALSWFEMLVSSWIVSWGMRRFRDSAV